MPATIDATLIAARDPAAPVIVLAGETMGTTWRVLLAPSPRVNVARVEAAIITRLAGLVAEMSHWDLRSLLSRFKRARAGSWLVLPPDFATVIAAAMSIAEASGGAFDPAIGRLVNLWGYGPPGPTVPPDARAIQTAHLASGYARLTYDPAARRLRQPGGLTLDLSGIAKGYAVDTVADLIAAAGMPHALVEIGGELAGRGVRPDGEPWWVDLEPVPDADLRPLRVGLHQLAVATSGTYLRGDHNLDPATGRPVADAPASVSVLHASAMIADAWASALSVLGPVAGMAMAERHCLAARIVANAADGYVEHLSPAVAAMLAD